MKNQTESKIKFELTGLYKCESFDFKNFYWLVPVHVTESCLKIIVLQFVHFFFNTVYISLLMVQ